MQIISGISARRAHKKMRAFAQRALLELLNVAAAVYRVGCAFKSEKSAHSASTSRKFCAEVARKKRKFFRTSARRAHKICVHSTSVRSENRRMSLQLFTESEICSHRKMRASGVRDHANFAANSCKKRIAKFSEFRRAAQKCVHSASVRFANPRALLRPLDAKNSSAFRSEKARARR